MVTTSIDDVINRAGVLGVIPAYKAPSARHYFMRPIRINNFYFYTMTFLSDQYICNIKYEIKCI